MINNRNYLNYLIILITGALVYIPYLGMVNLFDWDEINFAESAREMIVSGDYLNVQINFMSFWEKPPLFIWFQVLSMKIFGINEFAARFPNALCGIITLLILFRTGKQLYDASFGWTWVITYLGSVLPFFYFKSGIIDPWFNLFIFLGIIYFIKYLRNLSRRTAALMLSAFFIGLAIMTKGPVALLIFLLAFFVYLIINKFRINTNLRDIILFTTVLGVTGGFWFILQIFSGNFSVIKDFVLYQVRLFKTEDAGHGGFLFYHFIVLFFGVFPASVFALFGFLKKSNYQHDTKDFVIWMEILFFTVLILFTLVNTKIVHYSSLCYFPLTFIASLAIARIFKGEAHAGIILRFLIGMIAVIMGIMITLIPFIDILKERVNLRLWIKDEFALGNLQASGEWSGFEALTGVLFIILILWFLRNFSKNIVLAIRAVFIVTLAFVFLTMALIIPRIEGYSQRAAIDFYKSVAGKDAYITTLGFKSYAHLFYGGINPPSNMHYYEKGWLLKGDTDKDTYVVLKINRKYRYLREFPDLKVLYEKNGFVFTVRPAVMEQIPGNENTQ